MLSSLSSKQPSTVDDFLESSNLKDVDLFVVFKTSKVYFTSLLLLESFFQGSQCSSQYMLKVKALSEQIPLIIKEVGLKSNLLC